MSDAHGLRAPWMPSTQCLADQVERARRPLSLYLHVPFCSVRCGYCDFNTYTTGFGDSASLDSYHRAVVLELRYAADVLSSVESRPVDTVFVGGGTPTLLPDQGLGEIMRALRDLFELRQETEITIEANPDTVNERRLGTLAELGFNRVSVGMQSAVPSVLKTLDRTHEATQIPRVITAAKAAGLRTSLDLIYGTPGESLDHWRQSLRAAINTGTEHISTYALVIEPGTAMGAKLRRGLIPTVDSDDQANKYEIADAMLGEAGYQWYEISNWALSSASGQAESPALPFAADGDNTATGRLSNASRHNLAYWHDHDWWGIGPGAHSHWGAARWWNHKHPRVWADSLKAGRWPAAGGEVLTVSERDLEYLMLSIRTLDGTRITRISPSKVGRISELIACGLVERVGGTHLRLTLRGRLMADLVTRELSV